MAALPQRLPLLQMQQQWATTLNPVIANPIINGLMIPNQVLTIGANVVNHKLGRKLQGWFIVGINGVSDIYDTQATNQMDTLTLNLNSSAVVTVSLWVF